MNTAEAINRREAYTWGGWNLADDDTPKPPELSPLTSAQARRAWRSSAPAKQACRLQG